MESLSPKQVREIKDLYENVYKEEVVEEVGDFDDLFESEAVSYTHLRAHET